MLVLNSAATRWPLLVMVAVLLVCAVTARAADSVTTPLLTERCQVTARETLDEAGEKLPKKDWFATAWRCKGQGDVFVYIRYGHQREEIAFGNARRATSSYFQHGHFGSWGQQVEWRGVKDVRGQIAATAAIVPYRWDIKQGNSGQRETGGNLAVIRLGNAACIVALVDTVGNSDAEVLAREAADKISASTACASATHPHYLGKRSNRDG